MNDVQEVLSALWLQALDVPGESRIEGHEGFFERGGDSMTAIRLYMETEEKLAVKIDPSEFLGTLAEGGFDDLVKLVQQAKSNA